MSTASEDPPPDPPQHGTRRPGPLAILAATAVGGAIAARVSKAPLLFAAGAAAMALLRQKRPAPAPSPAVAPPQPPPAPPVEIPAQTQVEQWLSRQIMREEQTPLVDLSQAAAITPDAPEDDYHPGDFLLEDAEDLFRPLPPGKDAIAALADPVPLLFEEPEPRPQPALQDWAAPPPPPQVQEQAPPPPAVADSAWTLGVDPMPSFNEAAPHATPPGSSLFGTPEPPPLPFSTQAYPRSEVFSTAPVRQEELETPLYFATNVFQGATLPDEIQVQSALASEPTPPFVPNPPMRKPVTQEFSAPSEPQAPASPEILVELAAHGEASFDPPFAAAPSNPWQPPPEYSAAASAPASPYAQMSSTVVEAELILRPRAPTQNAVVAKSKLPTPAEDTGDAHFPGPLQSQHNPKPRPAWRSWWRDD